MTEAVVVGAGVTGAAVARELALRGVGVTLVEQHGPGTVRSASGGDTRLLRAAHGSEAWYVESAVRARALWLALEEETGTRIWEPCGLAWFARRADGFEAASRRTFERLGVRSEWLAPDDACSLFPSLETSDLAGVLFEPDAGVLHARRATQLLAGDAVAHGAELRVECASPDTATGTDVVVWACGAWLPSLFPGLVEVQVSRREVFFLGGGGPWNGAPGYVDYDGGYYGHGDVGGLGVKIAPDFDAGDADPELEERLPGPRWEELARDYAAHRFPALAGAPVVGARVCQYDLTADTHFVVDRHPEHPDWWLVGGGSGHSFKHAPALAEYVADCVQGHRGPEPFHRLGARTGDAGLRSGAT